MYAVDQRSCQAPLAADGVMRVLGDYRDEVEELLVSVFDYLHFYGLGDEGMAAYLNRSEEHTSELQSRQYLVCRLLLENKKKLAMERNRRECEGVARQPPSRP